MANKKVDVMLVSPMSYFQAKERANAELLVSTPTAADYKTAFITKADRSDINSISDLKGKTFAFVDQSSSSGYLYPKAKLVKDLSLDTDKLESSGYFFNTVAFSGGHPTSLTGVMMGDYDGAAVAKSVITQMVKANQLKESDIKVIGETDVIPNPCYVARGDLPADLKAKIKEFFLTYSDESYFEAVHSSKDIRFVEVSEKELNPAKEMLDLLKVDLGDK
ncbi:MAG: phosphate/phosphite/phosphonate ABC transporter substrate-binding protein, partial [Coprobacillus sp.]